MMICSSSRIAIGGILLACLLTVKGFDPNFVLPGETVPAGTLRIIALGTGTPTVTRRQVATSYLLQLGGRRNILFDAGTGSYINLLATAVDLASIDTV